MDTVLFLAGMAGDLGEFGGDRRAALLESGQTFLDGGFRLLPGRHSAAKLADGGGDFLRVLGIDLDGFFVEVKGAVADGGLDGAIGLGGDTGQLGKLEEARAELLPQANDVVRLLSAHVQIAWAEILPGGGTRQVKLLLAQAQEGFGLGR